MDGEEVSCAICASVTGGCLQSAMDVQEEQPEEQPFWMSFLINRFPKFKSSLDDCTEDIRVHRESRWFLTLSNDLCELSQIAGLFNYWDNAWKTLDSCKRRAAVIPSFLITMKNAMSACYSKRETHDSFLNISPESRKRVTPSCCRKTACRL